MVLNSKKKPQTDLADFDYEDTRQTVLNDNETDIDNILLNFTDEDVILQDGEEIKDKKDKELRSSMLILILLNMSVAYLQEGNFKEALESIEEARKMNERNSMIYFRRAQVHACNLGSSLKNLKQAKEDIEKAIYLNQFEEKNEQNIYVEEANFIQSRLKNQREKIKNIAEGFHYLQYE